MPSERAKQEAIARGEAGQGPGKANMTSRFLGLVVIPGKHIVQLEVEEPKGVELPIRGL